MLRLEEQNVGRWLVYLFALNMAVLIIGFILTYRAQLAIIARLERVEKQVITTNLQLSQTNETLKSFSLVEILRGLVGGQR